MNNYQKISENVPLLRRGSKGDHRPINFKIITKNTYE